MTNFQIETSTTEDLIIFFKNKARCFHSRHNAEKVFKAIQQRISDFDLNPLRLAVWHMQNEGSVSDFSIFDDECDALLAHQRKYLRDTQRVLLKQYLNKKH